MRLLSPGKAKVTERNRNVTKKRKPKTSGLEFLHHSVMSFNGTRYADHLSPEQFFDSYVNYKSRKKDMEAVQLAIEHKTSVMEWALELKPKQPKTTESPIVNPYPTQWYEDLPQVNRILKDELDIELSGSGYEAISKLFVRLDPSQFLKAVEVTKWKNIMDKTGRFSYLYAVCRNMGNTPSAPIK